MKMFYLIYHGRPNKDHPDKSIAGGMIGCWIERASIYKADKVARELIKEQNWDIIKKDRFKTVKPNSVDKDSEHYQYYDQALIDKEVLVFYTYPKTKKRTRKKI
ncbi:MAG: hypothetical protein HOP30_01135 [Cyclobacteriaceae bacterium]|nr:hypothetical protein [Cyclobacteriaceae bacterium]